MINGKTDITYFVKSATYSGDSQTFACTLSLSLNATKFGRERSFTIEEGDSIKCTFDDKYTFYGVVFAVEITSDGAYSLTCYDSNVYLNKSNDMRIFTNKKASDIIRILATDFGIPIGSIADTGYVIPFLRLSNISIYEMILKALTITRNQTGKRFFVKNIDGKLMLISGLSSKQYMFSDSENLISAKYSRSIEDTKTQVKVSGGEKGKEIVVVAKDDAKRKKYGVLQAVEILDEKATASQIKQHAETLLKEQSQVSEQLSIEVLGIPEVTTGTAVYVRNQMTGTNGAYYVTSFTHNYSDTHTMALELSRTYELPDIEINEDEMQ